MSRPDAEDPDRGGFDRPTYYLPPDLPGRLAAHTTEQLPYPPDDRTGNDHTGNDHTGNDHTGNDHAGNDHTGGHGPDDRGYPGTDATHALPIDGVPTDAVPTDPVATDDVAPEPRPTATLPLGPPTFTAPIGPPPRQHRSRTVVRSGGRAARGVTNMVVRASRADGAGESGLTPLIWNQVLSFGADAMITVALAGTVFFSAAQSEQKSNVLGYLLITMAPFAVVAPIIGPALDRLQHGRRGAMAASAFGRAVLAVLMAQNFDNLLALFPLALGSLVLSKAYSVVRAAAAPRVVPPGMTLVTANSRLSLFGLASALIGGGLVGGVIKLTGSYSLGLWITAIAFAVTGFFALRLPAGVDSSTPRRPHPQEPHRSAARRRVPSVAGLRSWAGAGFGQRVVTSMEGASLLRWTSGFLTLFLAFYIEKYWHGADAAFRLGAIGAAVGAGNGIGTAAGARLKLGSPDRLVIACASLSFAACLVTSVLFGLWVAVGCMFLTAAANSLGKLSLDAVIQRDVIETVRSSAFARSETFVQLAWVIGAAVALLLPAGRPALGLSVAAGVLGVSTVTIIVRNR